MRNIVEDIYLSAIQSPRGAASVASPVQENDTMAHEEKPFTYRITSGEPTHHMQTVGTEYEDEYTVSVTIPKASIARATERKERISLAVALSTAATRMLTQLEDEKAKERMKRKARKAAKETA